MSTLTADRAVVERDVVQALNDEERAYRNGFSTGFELIKNVARGALLAPEQAVTQLANLRAMLSTDGVVHGDLAQRWQAMGHSFGVIDGVVEFAIAPEEGKKLMDFSPNAPLQSILGHVRRIREKITELTAIRDFSNFHASLLNKAGKVAGRRNLLVLLIAKAFE
ncbi:MAG: hypothetical protein Q7S65_04225 [Nanoarchaeota archaeon]|nr:hypothetical protein [Nanoarchaeota archaeon]